MNVQALQNLIERIAGIKRVLTAPAGKPANLPQGVEHFVQEADGSITAYIGPLGGGAPVKVSGGGAKELHIRCDLNMNDIGEVSATVVRDDFGGVGVSLQRSNPGQHLLVFTGGNYNQLYIYSSHFEESVTPDLWLGVVDEYRFNIYDPAGIASDCSYGIVRLVYREVQ